MQESGIEQFPELKTAKPNTSNQKYELIYAEWLYKMHFEHNCVISDDQWQLMGLHGLVPLNELMPDYLKVVKRDPKKYGVHKRNWKILHKHEIEASKHVTVTEIQEDDAETIENIIHVATRKITRKDWMPESVISHKPDFVAWINAITTRYPKLSYYEKFSLYCQQADDWFASGETQSDFDDEEELEKYHEREFWRCRTNCLYFANKYAYRQKSKAISGLKKYYAGDTVDTFLHHRIRFYLIDCWYSTCCGKPRQIGDSTVMGIAGIRDIVFYNGIYTKFITKTETKGIEIFRDKFKVVWSNLPDWMQEEATYSGTKYITLGTKPSAKGIIPKGNSTLEVSPPATDAINGGTPAKVKIDEADSINNLGEIIAEGRPTMYDKDEETGLLVLSRQIDVWSTGVYGDNSKGAFESFYKQCRENWDDGLYEYGILPLFFNWRARCTPEDYQKQLKFYTSASKMKSEGWNLSVAMTQFNMHFPSTPDDMFSMSDKLLIPIEEINDGLNRIRDLSEEQKPTYGYMMPIYDENSPVENQDVAFKIVGARFVPTSEDDPQCTTMICAGGYPDKKWKWRYFAGTDTIDNDTGLSKQTTSIYDRILGCKCALMNYRKQHSPEHSFLQSMLLTMFYDTNNDGRVGCKEVIENNRAKAYYNYKREKGYCKNVVYNSELPIYLRGGGALWGVDNKDERNTYIIGFIRKYYLTSGKRDTIDIGFIQLKTFEESISDKKKKSQWKTRDPRKWLDDVLFSDAYSLICSECFSNKLPEDTKTESYNPRTRKVAVMQYSHGKTVRTIKTVKV